MRPLQIFSVCAFVLLAAGYTQRRRPRRHIPLVLSAFLIDLGIVVYIEVMRGAFVSAKAKMGLLMGVHIALSVAVLVFYAGQIVTGIRNVRGRRSWWHRYGGESLLLTRLGNLITSFLVM